jgi:7-carboxy-7-deazaguanine synthase
MYYQNPYIKEMMLTGGSPTMHPALVNELTHFANTHGIFITMETEGSHFLQTDYPIDLLSISPKFSNSIPVVGIKTPQGATVDERMVRQHNKLRLNYEAIGDSIAYHRDYQIKPVLDKDLSVVEEVEEFLRVLDIPDDKVWVMPSGDSVDALVKSYGPVINKARDRGWNFTGRPHIIAFDKDRFV